jgi:hypothetical protein
VPVLSQTQPQELAGRPPGTKAFDGGEGVWFDSDHVYFTNKGESRVWDLDVAAQTLRLLYDAEELGEDAPLTGVDNLVVSPSADIFLAEDDGNLEIVLITPDRVVAPVMRLGRARQERDLRAGLPPGRLAALLLLPARHPAPGGSPASSAPPSAGAAASGGGTAVSGRTGSLAAGVGGGRVLHSPLFLIVGGIGLVR